MIILPPCIADFNILFNETAFFLQRYFIRFDRLILLSRVVHIATHVSTVTSCIELWFPTSASVASPPFFFFLSFSPSLVLFLSLLRVFFSSSSSFFFFHSFLFLFFFYVAALLCGKDDRISLRRACCAIEADAAFDPEA